MTLPLMANAARIWKRSNTSSIRQKPTRFPYSCHAQFGISGIGAPPAGGVRTVRGMVSRGFHSSTFTISHTTRRAPFGSTSRGRSFIAEYDMRSVGSIVTSPFSRPRISRTCHVRGVQSLENRQRIDWRSRATFNGQRRERDHEFIALQSSRGGDRLFQVEALDNVDPHPVEHSDMDRVGHSLPAWSRIPVDVEIMPNERRQALVHPGNRVGVITGDLAGPWPHLLASLPASDVEQRHIPRSGLHARLLFPGFQIGARHRHAWLDPLGAFQLSNVVQDGASNDAVLPIHDAALL